MGQEREGILRIPAQSRLKRKKAPTRYIQIPFAPLPTLAYTETYLENIWRETYDLKQNYLRSNSLNQLSQWF